EKEIAEKSTFAVTWYGGEPLMAKHIIKKLTKEFIRICDEKESKYHAGIITNGYLLSKENLDFLIDSKVTFAQVTIDGPEKIHNVRRPLKMGGKTFQRIISNVEQINDELPIKVAIRVNIDKRNVDKVPELLDDLKNRGINSKKNVAINFGQTVQYKNSCPNISLHCMASSEFAEFMIDAYNYALDCDFIISSFPALQIGSCGAVGTNSYLIEPNGNLQLCWATVGNDSYKIGSLEKDGLVYNNNYTKWLGWTPFRSNCNNCEVLPICMGGCPYKTIYKDDVIDGENNICVWWKYNLGSMLDITKEAKNKNQLIVLR
ncbi:MAG: radical SAM protein, partial [Methanosarcinaceae archaeon]